MRDAFRDYEARPCPSGTLKVSVAVHVLCMNEFVSTKGFAGPFFLRDCTVYCTLPCHHGDGVVLS